MRRVVWTGAAMLVLNVSGIVTAGDLEGLRAQVEQLRQRVAELEAENAELRRRLRTAEQAERELTVERDQLEKLAGVTARGEQVESDITLVESVFDAEADRTQVRFKPRRINAPGGGPFEVDHFLSVAYSYAGQVMQTPPEHVDLLIHTLLHPTARYKSIREVEVVVDEQVSLSLPLGSYEVLRTRRPPPSQRGTTPTRYDELLRFTLDGDALSRLAIANEAVIRMPGNDLVLTRQHLALLTAARRRIRQGL